MYSPEPFDPKKSSEQTTQDRTPTRLFFIPEISMTPMDVSPIRAASPTIPMKESLGPYQGPLFDVRKHLHETPIKEN